jgi:hypothetical protein
VNAKVARTLKSLRPGDAVEIVWNDANTTPQWMDPEEAAGCTLARILTRGTLIRVGDDAVRVALDAGIRDGSEDELKDFHSVGTVDIGSITEVYRLERKKPRRVPPRIKK